MSFGGGGGGFWPLSLDANLKTLRVEKREDDFEFVGAEDALLAMTILSSAHQTFADTLRNLFHK